MNRELISHSRLTATGRRKRGVPLGSSQTDTLDLCANPKTQTSFSVLMKVAVLKRISNI